MDPDTVYKALRPVPEFDGNPHILPRFIRICDQIVIQCVKDEPGYELSNLCVINGILNKITGPAARTINSNGIPENWIGIRNTLVNNFSDQRDETALYNDLALATQCNDTPQEFYDKCQNLFSTIMSYVSLHETLETTVEAKRILYRKLTLQAFVRGLKDPLGSRIRCMRPETIEKALEFVQDELNVIYLQQRNNLATDQRKPSSSSAPHNSYQQFTQPKFPPMNNNFNPPKFSPGPSWQKPNFNPQFNNHQRTPMQPTRTQQMFRAPLPNYNSGFRIPNRNPPQNNSGPKPMSGVSHFVTKPLPPRIPGHDWQKFGNPPPSNYFRSRELNFNEFCDYNDYEYGNDGNDSANYNYYNTDYDYNDYYGQYVNDDYDNNQYCEQQDLPPIENSPHYDSNMPSTSKAIQPRHSNSSRNRDFQQSHRKSAPE